MVATCISISISQPKKKVKIILYRRGSEPKTYNKVTCKYSSTTCICSKHIQTQQPPLFIVDITVIAVILGL